MLRLTSEFGLENFVILLIIFIFIIFIISYYRTSLDVI